jgi:hypothetical protein
MRLPRVPRTWTSQNKHGKRYVVSLLHVVCLCNSKNHGQGHKTIKCELKIVHEKAGDLGDRLKEVEEELKKCQEVSAQFNCSLAIAMWLHPSSRTYGKRRLCRKHLSIYNMRFTSFLRPCAQSILTERTKRMLYRFRQHLLK